MPGLFEGECGRCSSAVRQAVLQGAVSFHAQYLSLFPQLDVQYTAHITDSVLHAVHQGAVKYHGSSPLYKL